MIDVFNRAAVLILAYVGIQATIFAIHLMVFCTRTEQKNNYNYDFFWILFLDL